MEMLPVVVLFCVVLFLPGTFIPEPSKIMSLGCSNMHFSGPASRQAAPLSSPGDIGGPAWWGLIWTGVTRTSSGSYFSRSRRSIRGSLSSRRLPGSLETKEPSAVGLVGTSNWTTVHRGASSRRAWRCNLSLVTGSNPLSNPRVLWGREQRPSDKWPPCHRVQK